MSLETVKLILDLFLVIVAVGGVAVAVIKWFVKQNSQDEVIEELKKTTQEEMAEMRREQRILTEGILACLDGLTQQGCNHTVPSTKKKIEEYLIEVAHK